MDRPPLNDVGQERRNRRFRRRRARQDGDDYYFPNVMFGNQNVIHRRPPVPNPIRDYYMRMNFPFMHEVLLGNNHLLEAAGRINLQDNNGRANSFSQEKRKRKSKKTKTDKTQKKAQPRVSEAKKVCREFLKLQVDKFTVLVPHREISWKQIDSVLARINKLGSLCNDKFENSNELLWNILKISSKLEIESAEGITHHNGFYSMPMKFSDHLRFLSRLNFSHNLDINDTNFQALRNYCDGLSYINVNGCLNLTTSGMLTIRSLGKFKSCFVDIYVQPRIFNAKILSRISSIEILDTDSLSAIFKMVPLAQRLTLGDVCPLWKDILNDFWAKLKSLDFSTCPDKIDLETFTKIIRRCKKLRNVDFNIIQGPTPDKDLTVLFLYMKYHTFKNLITLNMSNIILTDHLLRLFVAPGPYPKMRKLTLGAHDSITGDLIRKALALTGNLVYLKLTSNRTIHGDFLKGHFHNLETLQIHNCIQAIDHIETAIHQMPALKNLSITNCRNFSDPSIKITSSNLRFLQLNNNYPQIIIGTCRALETLDLSHDPLVDDDYLKTVRESCPNLKRVILNYCNHITDTGLRYITSLPRIEHLSLNSMISVSDRYLTIYSLKTLECRNCPRFYNAGLIQLLSAASALEVLDLTNCPYITQHLVEYAVKSTKRRTNNVTLTMHVGGTNVVLNEIMDESPRLRLVDVPEPLSRDDETNPKYYYATIDQFDED